jgi:CheY-like chemotaxis protein
MNGVLQQRKKVLVIDDSDAARHAIRELLQQADYDVLVLPSAIGATRLILQQRIEAVIVDLSMPGLSGDRLVEVLRKNSKLSNLIVILVSGESEDDLQKIRAKVEVDAVMSKLAVKHELVPLLTRLFTKGRVAVAARDA